MKNSLEKRGSYTIAHAVIALRKSTDIIKISVLIIYLLFGFFSSGNAQTTSLTFTQIPFSSDDIITSGRGAEHWLSNSDFDNVNSVRLPSPTNVRMMNFYKRINWAQIEYAGTGTTPASTRYHWDVFDMFINSAIDNGQKFSFGVLNMAQGYPAYGSPGGGALSYPTWMHNKMQTEITKDWLSPSGDWVPDYNSNTYLTALDDLNKAIADHINTTSYKGVPYKNIIFYVDIRGYGNFGEWHNSPWFDAMKSAGRLPTIASYKRMIDSHKSAFPDYPLVSIMNNFDSKAGNASEIPPEIVHYALTQSNNWGLYGWRRDNWGANFFDDVLANNSTVYGGWRADTAILNRYKYAPIVGEPYNGSQANINGGPYGDLPREIRLYHANSFGNNNYYLNVSTSTFMQDSIRMASKLCGYRLILEGGNMTTTLSGGLPFSISLNWKNVGLAPTYENWNVTYELRNVSNVAVWTGTSSFKPRLFLPAGTATVITDNFTLPASITPGTYTMVMVIRDPIGYAKPLGLAITGRAADGSYPLRSVTVTAAINQLPVADAGGDIITNTSTAALDGTGTYDPDGTIAAYKWTKVSGPATYSISNTTIASPLLSGLLLGDYVFQLEATDNIGAKAKDTVYISSVALVLPVKWLYFNATPIGGKIEIKWSTQGEFQNDRFEIERSNDAKNFNQIGVVNGAGTSVEKQSYQFIDDQVSTGKIYYRIRQVSKDGTKAYSTIIMVNRNSVSQSVEVFPNPASDHISVAINNQQPGKVNISIFSLDGKLVKQQQLMKENDFISTSVDINNLRKGVYLIKIMLEDNIVEARKFIKN